MNEGSVATAIPPSAGPVGRPLRAAFARFLGVGALGLAADLAVFSVLDARGVGPAPARLASLGAALLVTWSLNRRFTFDPSGRGPAGELLRYGLGALVAQGLGYAVFLALVHGAPALPRALDLLVGAGLAAFAGFACHRLYVFRAA